MSYLNKISMIHTLDDGDVNVTDYSYSDYKNDILMIESTMYHDINKIADEMSIDSIHALYEGASIDSSKVKDSRKYADSVKSESIEKIVDKSIMYVNSQYNKVHKIILEKIDFADSHKNDIMSTTISDSYSKCEGKCKKVLDVKTYSKLLNKFKYVDFIKSKDNGLEGSSKYKKVYKDIVSDIIGDETALTADKINSGKDTLIKNLHKVDDVLVKVKDNTIKYIEDSGRNNNIESIKDQVAVSNEYMKVLAKYATEVAILLKKFTSFDEGGR